MEYKMYTDKEIKLIRDLEKCNYEYLLSKENLKICQRKSRFDYDRFKTAFDFKTLKNKYMKKYHVNKYPFKVKELGWDKKKNDSFLYMKENKKIVVYTCISGKYDNLNEPRFTLNPNITYIMYTNQDIKSKVWEIRPIPEHLNSLNDTLINRYLKMHPHEFFGEYDYSIYIDGNVEVISDMSGLVTAIDNTIGFSMHLHSVRECIYQEAVSCQAYKKGNSVGITCDVEKYLSEGFPYNYGLLECTVFATDVHNETSKKIFEDWWNEFRSAKSGRDQLSLPVVLWRKGISIERCGTMGSNLYRNPKFRVLSHKK